MTLPELIANEVMNAIERERRINKDDLIVAAKVAIMKHDAEALSSHPLMVAEPTYESLRRLSTQQEMMRIDSQTGGGFEFFVLAPHELPSHTGSCEPTHQHIYTTGTTQEGVPHSHTVTTAKPGCISSAEAARQALGRVGTPLHDKVRELMDRQQQHAASVHHVNIATCAPPSFTHTNIAASCTASAGLGYQGVQIVNDPASSVQQYEIHGDTTWVKTKSTNDSAYPTTDQICREAIRLGENRKAVHPDTEHSAWYDPLSDRVIMRVHRYDIAQGEDCAVATTLRRRDVKMVDLSAVLIGAWAHLTSEVHKYPFREGEHVQIISTNCTE